MMDPSYLHEAMMNQQHSSAPDHSAHRPFSENQDRCVPLETLIDHMRMHHGQAEVHIIFNEDMRHYLVKHEPPDTMSNMQDFNLVAGRDRECAPGSEGDKDHLHLEAIFRKTFTPKHAKFDFCGILRRTSTV